MVTLTGKGWGTTTETMSTTRNKSVTNSGTSIEQRRAVVWAAAASLVILALLSGAAGQVRAAPSNGGSVPYRFASVPSPNAVAATPTELLVLSASSCSTVYSVSPTGAVAPFASLLSSVKKCPEQAIAVSTGLGNFPAGIVYVLQQGSLFEIPAVGSSSAVAATLTLPNLSGGYAGLAFDYSGSFGYDLLAVGGTSGNVVAIDPANHLTPIGSFGTAVEGPSVAPYNFGSVAGELLAGTAGHSTVYAMSFSGTVTSFAQWKDPEAVSFVPQLTCSYAGTGDAYFVADLSANALLALPSSAFSAVAGSALVLGEYHGEGVGLLAANGTTSSFLSLSGTLEGASYVACPLGVAQTIDLASHGFASSSLTPLGFDPATRQILGSDRASAPTRVFLLDGTSGAFVRNVTVGLYPSAATYNPKLNALYVANRGSDNLTLLNATTFASLGSIPTGAGSAPVGVVFNPSNEKLYVANAGNQTVTIYSLANNLFPNQKQVIPLSGTPRAIDYDPANNNIFLIGNATGGGIVWEIHAFAVVANLTLPAAPGGLAVNTTSGLLYVTLPGLNEVAFVTPTDALASTVGVGNQPTGIAFDAYDGHLVVGNAGDGTFSVLEGTLVVDSYFVGANPSSLVYDPTDHLVYVAANVTLSGIDPRIILGTTS